MNAVSNVAASAEILWFGNTLVTIRLPSSAGTDGIAVLEHRMPFGDTPPLHVHRNEDEIFHILEGTMRFRVDGQDVVAGAGETVLAPKGVPHTFRVESAGGVRCLTVTRGADFETLVRATGRPAARAELPEPAAPTPEMIAALVRIAAENGIDIVGPPLA